MKIERIFAMIYVILGLSVLFLMIPNEGFEIINKILGGLLILLGLVKFHSTFYPMPHNNEEMRDFKEKIQEHLDLHFPKDGCKERGPALVLFAEAIYLANKQISDLKKSIREEIGEKKDWYSGEGNEPIRKVLDEILSLKSLE